jgi:hypothetical protein
LALDVLKTINKEDFNKLEDNIFLEINNQK